MVDQKTAHLQLPLPHLDNTIDEDCPRVRQALTQVDGHAEQTDRALQQHDAALSTLSEQNALMGVRQDSLERQVEQNREDIASNVPRPATPDDLGMVRVGQGISVDETGLISTEPVTLATPGAPGIVQVGAGLEVTLPTEAAEGEEAPTPGILSLGAHASEGPDAYGKGDFQFYGHVKLTDNFEEETAAKDGVAISARGVKDAWDRLFGVVKGQTITTSGTWTVPETGNYTVSCVGGGGNGGGGGAGYGTRNFAFASGGGGGGGGAGKTVTMSLSLTKGEVIPITIGSASGTTSFGAYISALGGGAGGGGGNGSARYEYGYDGGNNVVNASGGAGGAAGVTYAGASTAGASGTGRIHDNGSVAGGVGGNGGTSINGIYGNGGHGGQGGSASLGGYGYISGSAGTAGTQGCVIINSPISGG